MESVSLDSVCGAGLQIPDVLPDGCLLEPCQTFGLLHRQDGRHAGRLGCPVQAE